MVQIVKSFSVDRVQLIITILYLWNFAIVHLFGRNVAMIVHLFFG
jgi:hypothetical protein